MALAASLIPGYDYEVLSGPLAGEVVSVIDNTTFPDSDVARRRKVTVEYDGQTVYIIPRLLANLPVGASHAAPIAPVTTKQRAPGHFPPPNVPLPVIDNETLTAIKNGEITDPMDDRLDHLRPSKALVRKYKSRIMPNGQTDIEFFLTFTNSAYRSENAGRPANVMLKGDTQGGKTMLVRLLAIKWSELMGLPKYMPVFTLSGSSGVTDYDLFGQTTSYTDPATGKERLVWLPGVVDLAARIGGILYLDEVNAMGERVTSSLHPLADDRHHFVNRNKGVDIGGVILPETVEASLDLWIIGTYNEGYRGMVEMNEAFINRFRHIRWDYDKTVEAKLVTSPTVRLLGEALRTARETGQIRTPVGTAALEHVERDVHSFGIEMGLDILLGQFKANERSKVQAIYNDRSIVIGLREELKALAPTAPAEDEAPF